MIDQHHQAAPTPVTVAAWFVLGTTRTERVPWWAAQWLVEGHDGQALRELAGLDGREPHAVNDLLPNALAEMGVALPSAIAVAAEEAFRKVAEMFLAGRATERLVVQQVDEIVARADYNDDVLGLPLGQLYGTEDAWHGGWGPPIAELKATVRACCAAQLRAA